VRPDDSSGNVTAEEDSDTKLGAEATRATGDARRSADDALRLAITLAVEAGDYDRAAMLLEVARRVCSRPGRH
jgi:hypothetical protein